MFKVLFVFTTADDIPDTKGLEILYASNAHDAFAVLDKHDVGLVVVDSNIPFWDSIRDRREGYVEIVNHVERPINKKGHDIAALVICQKNCPKCSYKKIKKDDLRSVIPDFMTLNLA